MFIALWGKFSYSLKAFKIFRASVNDKQKQLCTFIFQLNCAISNAWYSIICYRFSKHPFIADASQVTPLFDGSPSAVSYADSRNNRFKFIPGGVDIFSRIHPPSKVLHYFNAPPDCPEEHLKHVFQAVSAEAPLKQATFSKSKTCYYERYPI